MKTIKKNIFISILFIVWISLTLSYANGITYFNIFSVIFPSPIFATEYLVIKSDTVCAIDSTLFSHITDEAYDSLISSGACDSLLEIERLGEDTFAVYLSDSLLFKVRISDNFDQDIMIIRLIARAVQHIKTEKVKPKIVLSKNVYKLILLFISPIIFVFLVFILNKISKKLVRTIIHQEGHFIKDFRIGKLTIFPARDEVLLLINIVKWLKIILIIILFYVLLMFIFSSYPGTHDLASKAITAVLGILQKVGIFLLKFAGYVLLAIVFTFFARLSLRIVEIIFRHYQKNPEHLAIPIRALQQVKLVLKVFISLLFILGFILLIPGPTEFLALSIFIFALIVIVLAILPITRSYVFGYGLIAKSLVKVGDTVYYNGEHWHVEKITPLYIFLKTTIDSVNEKSAIILTEKIIEHGIIIEKQHTSENNIENKD